MKNKKTTLIVRIISMVAVALFLIYIVISYVHGKVSKNLLTIALTAGLIFLSFRTSQFFFKEKDVFQGIDTEKETEDVLKFLEFKKEYKCFNESDARYITVRLKDTEEVPHISYLSTDSYFGGLDHSKTFIGVGLGFLGFEVNPNNLTVTGFKGYAPKSVWITKNLPTFTSTKKELIIDTVGFYLNKELYLHLNMDKDYFFDKKKNTLLIGTSKNIKNDEYYEIFSGVYISLNGNKIKNIVINFNLI